MKKFLVVLLSLGLIAAFSMPSSAVDLKLTGSYYAQGFYVDNHELKDDNDSRAFVSQRFRLQPVFQIADGLKFTTRFDALEKKWGDQRWSAGFEDVRNRKSNSPDSCTYEQENIEFERAYVTFATQIGQFDAGYQQGSSLFGTSFLDSEESIGRILFTRSFGPHTLALSWEKFNEYMTPGGTTAGSNKDADDTAYAIAGITKFKGGEAGLIYKFVDMNSEKTISVDPYSSTLHVINPYLKMQSGPLFVEAELYYIGGKAIEYENSSAPDVDAESYGGYVKAQMDMAPAYVGAMFVYMTGDDPDSTDETEGGFMPALHWGENFSPCLILWNSSYQTWLGAETGYAGDDNKTSKYMDNVMMGQIYGGFKPTPKLHVKASVSYGVADEKPAGFVDDEYGTELDVTASYKIFDNLEYMIGAAYLFAGDYFKGTDSCNKVDDNYLLTHKLTLTF